MRRRALVLTTAAFALALTACSGGESSNGGTTSDQGVDGTDAASCDPSALETLTEGTLTVGTSTPYEPWYIGEDPTTGEGFESALVYAVADQLGFAAEDVTWENVTFEQIIAPNIKPFDFAAYQTTITPERAEVVDFSAPYLDTYQGVVVADSGDYAEASALSDLEGAQVGVTAGQTSLTDAEAAWGDAVELVPYDDAGMAMQAMSSGQIDAVVMDVSQAVSASTVYFPDTSVIGTLPASGEPAQLGLVLDAESPLTPCVSDAVEALRTDGTLDALASEWLNTDGIPELS